MDLKARILARREKVERREQSRVFRVEIGLRSITRKDYKDAQFYSQEEKPDRQAALYAFLFHIGTFDPATGKSIFDSPDEVLELAGDDNDAQTWEEIERLSERVFALAGVGAEALKSGDSSSDSQ